MLERKVKKKQEIRIMEDRTMVLNRVNKENSQVSDHWSEELEEVRKEVMETSGG